MKRIGRNQLVFAALLTGFAGFAMAQTPATTDTNATANPTGAPASDTTTDHPKAVKKKKTPAKKKAVSDDVQAPTEPIVLGVPRMQNSVYDYRPVEQAPATKTRLLLGVSSYQPSNYTAPSILFQPTAFRSAGTPEISLSLASSIFEASVSDLDQQITISYLQLERSGNDGIPYDPAQHQQMNLSTLRYGVSKAFTLPYIGNHLKPFVGVDLAALWAEAESGAFNEEGISQVFLAHSERAGLRYSWGDWAAEAGGEVRSGFSSSLINGSGAYLDLSVRL